MFLFEDKHLLPFLHLFLHLLFFEFLHSDAAYNTLCSTTLCDGVNISYPFWLDTGADMYCGYPGFGLKCPEGNTTKPTLDFPEDSYHVTDINYDDNSLTLVDIDVSGIDCPRARHNLTVGTTPLHYNDSLDVNISFYFNCSAFPNGFLNQVSCLRFEEKHSYVFIAGEEPGGFDPGNCEEKVVAAVKEEAVSMSSLVDTFDEALNKGFVLDWKTAKECGACDQSEGRCGYNGSEHLLCFCDDMSVKINGTCTGSQGALMKPLIGGIRVWYDS